MEDAIERKRASVATVSSCDRLNRFTGENFKTKLKAAQYRFFYAN
jgi:hypothetical protein